MVAHLRSPRILLLAALFLGLCAERLFYGRWPGVSVPLFVALGLTILAGLSRHEGRPPTRANRWLGAAALGFALLSMVRAAPLLVMLNLSACAGLLLLLVANYRGAALPALPGWRYFTHPLLALLELSLRPAPLLIAEAGRLTPDATRARRLIPVGRGLALALPVVSVFALLLMAADSVFASYVFQIVSLRLPIDPALPPRAAAVLFVGWICAGGMLAALYNQPQPREELASLPAEGETQRLPAPARSLRLLGCVEALTVLSAVNLLFGGFLLVQGAYFFGGLDTLARTRMTYAEYARRGFFELLVVALLALGLVWTLALVTRRESFWQRRAFKLAGALLIALVLGLLASAFQRMLLYEQAYGFTELRVYTHSFMLWLAVILLLFLAALLGERPRLFAFGSFVAALVYLATLNVANPDALIVQANITRYHASGKLDAAYLAQLSPDATPELVAALEQLDPADQALLEAALSRQFAQLNTIAMQSGWPGWHLSRAQAQVILASNSDRFRSPAP